MLEPAAHVKWKLAIFLAAGLGGLGWAIAARLSNDGGSGRRSGMTGPAPVEVAPVLQGSIELQRTFTGALEARARFVVAAHVGGRVQRLLVDLADPVDNGQVVATLDDAEHVQTVAEQAAELAVARANLADATSGLEIATRERDRLEALEAQGIVSTSALDSARSDYLARDTALKVAKAHVTRASAALERARIRSGYANVVAAWSGDDEQRVVAERHVDEGVTVAANAPLLTVVAIDPLDAVVHVSEKEYGQLAPGQAATITTDAFPDREFLGSIARIAPVFRETSRQARMELQVPNPDRVLKPGMFVRARIVLGREDDATIVPLSALTTRDGKTGVFVVNDAGDRVAWRAVEIGIREGDRVAVEGDGVDGRVVTLGQQLIDDGSAIEIAQTAPIIEARGGS